MSLPPLRIEGTYQGEGTSPYEDEASFNLGLNVNAYVLDLIGLDIPRPDEDSYARTFYVGTNFSASYRVLQNDLDLRLTVPFFMPQSSDWTLSLGDQYFLHPIFGIDGQVTIPTTKERRETFSAAGEVTIPFVHAAYAGGLMAGYVPVVTPVGGVILRGGVTDLGRDEKPFFEASLQIDPVSLIVTLFDN